MKNLIFLFFLTLFSLSACAQNGKILSRNKVDLKKLPIWSRISANDTLSSDFKHLEKVDLYRITYSSDSKIVSGIYMAPKKGGKYPVIIFNRGGNRDFGKLNIPSMIHLNSKLAANGFVIIGSNYRREDEFGGKDLNDVLALFQTLNEIEEADTSRIGMFGWSRGGMMTYLSMKETCNLKTAVVGNGPVDLIAGKKFRPRMETGVYAECIPNYEENKEAELKKRSVIYWPDSLCKTTSLLILSGKLDKRTDPNQIDRLATKLDEIDYDYKLIKRETDHFFSDKKDELADILAKWFEDELVND